MSYSERLVVITGAAGGIGRETAKLFLQRGASLLLIDRNEAALQDLEKSLASPTRVRTLTSALESPKACAHAIGCAHRPIYALVHMAGIFIEDPLTAESRPTWDQTIGANLTNAYDLIIASRPRFETEVTPRIVLMTSLAFRRGSFDHVAYSAAKGGLVGLTRALSRALAPSVLVNAIAPGVINTNMPAQIIRDRGDRLLAEIPLKRWGAASEVADVAEFLCGPQSTYITGQVINVDGGIVNS